MTIIPDRVLIESSTARDYQLNYVSDERALEILNKIKSLYFGLWQGTEIATTQQVAEFYEVPEVNIRKVIERHRSELELDGLKNLRGKELKSLREQVCDNMSLSPNTHRLTIHTARSTLRLGMLLENSFIAQAVRTTLLNAVEKVVPAQAQEIERLKLELELVKTKERLLATTSALTAIHGSEMVALMMGKPDALVTRTERVETLVEVDNRGKAIAKFNGVGITYLAKRYGFGTNTKACRYWLESIGVTPDKWLTEPTLVKTQKLSRELLPLLDRAWAGKKGVRQRLLGE
jgi:hypothetical protein